MSSTPFGERLKRERELRGVTLDEVSAATKINTRYLEALETAHWAQLPGGAFNRGFIRSVSRFLGLDEDDMIAEYSLETKGATRPLPARVPIAMPRNWKPLYAALALVALALACVFFGIHVYRARKTAQQKHASALVSGQTSGSRRSARFPESLASYLLVRSAAD
jgi:cytoskeletal protein RodZ